MHPSRPVRFGIIGAGNFTAAHVAEFRKLANVEVVAVCRRNAEALAAAQRQWGVPDGFSDHRDLLTLDGLDAVAIVTPTDSHRPIALDAIAAGKHVLREKPLALSAADAQEMLDAADAAGVVHATNFNQRGRTTAGQLQRYLADGFVGRIYHLNVWYGHSAQADVRPDYSAWRFRPESGGGTVYELCHVFDMARFLCGEVRRLCALLSTNEPHRAFPDVPEGMAISVPDSSAFLLEFAGGATGVAHTSWVARGLDAEGPNSMRVEVSGSGARSRRWAGKGSGV